MPLSPTAGHCIREALGLADVPGLDRVQRYEAFRAATTADPLHWRRAGPPQPLSAEKVEHEATQVASRRRASPRSLQRQRERLVHVVADGLASLKRAYATQNPNAIFGSSLSLKKPVHELRVVLQAAGDKGALPYRASQFRGTGEYATGELLAWAHSLDTWLLAEGAALGAQPALDCWGEGPTMVELPDSIVADEARLRLNLRRSPEEAFAEVDRRLAMLRDQLMHGRAWATGLQGQVHFLRVYLPMLGYEPAALPPHRRQFDATGKFYSGRNGNFVAAVQTWIDTFDASRDQAGADPLPEEVLVQEATWRRDPVGGLDGAIDEIKTLFRELHDSFKLLRPSAADVQEKAHALRLRLPLLGYDDAVALPPHRRQFDAPERFAVAQDRPFLAAVRAWLDHFMYPPSYPATVEAQPRPPRWEPRPSDDPDPPPPYAAASPSAPLQGYGPSHLLPLSLEG
jgi:hypothetical protein